MSMASRRAAASLVALAALAAAPAAQAGPYRFTRILDSSGPLFPLANPVINDAGTVAYGTFSNNFTEVGVFTTTSGGATTAILPTPNDVSGVNVAAINNAGTVAFYANLDDGHAELLTGGGGPLTTIASGGPGGPFNDFGNPAINDAGVVAFFAQLNAGGTGIFTGSGGATTTIATSTDGPFFDFNLPSINNAGTVAFYTILDDGHVEIVTVSGGPLTTIASNAPGGPFGDFGNPAINDAGVVAFLGYNEDLTDTGIFTIGGGVTTTIATTDGPFSGFGEGFVPPAINNSGTVAFFATLDAGGSGFFTGPDTDDAIIRVGDPLDGSTVTFLEEPFVPLSLNDAGSFGFVAVLADGRRGLYVATVVPEPSSLALAGLAGVLGLGYGWRRRRVGRSHRI